jgi:hypothetical protein
MVLRPLNAGQQGTSVQVWGCAISHASPDNSPNPQLFPCIYTLGKMCNFSLGVWETHLHTLGPIFTHIYTHLVPLFVFGKKKNACLCCLEIFVDLRIMI